MTTPFTATVLGLPRIGPRRELKRAVESYWAGRISAGDLLEQGRVLREQQIRDCQGAGLDSIPVGTFSHYDHVLDTAVMLGALPSRYEVADEPLDRYFAAARGTDEVAPLEMTKWFDTNYHYIVPEIGTGTAFALHPDKLLTELGEAQALGAPVRPVVLGPLSFLILSKAVDCAPDPLTRISDILPLYVDLLALLADAGAQWVQIDEPCLVQDLDTHTLELLRTTYEALTAAPDRPAILLASYFGHLGEALPVLANSAVEGLALDLVAGPVPEGLSLPGKHLVAGVVDGRNIWRTDLDAALHLLDGLVPRVDSLAVSTSCSLLHVPYSLDAEVDLDDALRSWLAFGAEKAHEVSVLADALQDRGAVEHELAGYRAVAQSRRSDARLNRPDVRDRLTALDDTARRRSPAAVRREEQASRLGLPPLPTTTIGSYPQTAAIRSARVDLRKGRIDRPEYERRMRTEIDAVIALQEKVGLDVLVHGEPERNDMVQYFAEQLDGFATTANGWVQSYGSRCVRPPILFGDVVRTAPMTVDWIGYAQSLTAKPVKGMLTGPVTILAWSFVRDDQPLADTADQVALAIRDESVDLEALGIAIVQVDEPALRELLPLRKDDQSAYLAWSVGAFRLATSGVQDATQVHTHLCYSEFGEVIGAIAELDADVTSIEAARSRMEVLKDLNSVGFDLGVGPGVYDIHSPRVPNVEEMATLLRAARESVSVTRLWANPDCGLKTRTTEEVTAALRNLVTAAHMVRAESSML